MSQPIGSNGKGTLYSSVLDCARKTYNEAGMIAFYKGFIPNWMRKAPWCVIFFISYENYRASMSIY
jgi:hypothetical protein